MKIQVRNIRDRTPVRVRVVRINDPDKPSGDEGYAETGKDLNRSKPGFQPGLQKLVVKDDWVSRDIGDIEGVVYPWVRMNKYDLHWRVPGRNYYAFYVAFGKRGQFRKCSERNFQDEKKRKKCLHLLYTVFIHRSSPVGGKMALPAYTRTASQLYSLFKKSRDYRPYRLNGPPPNGNHWIRRFRNRYIVIFFGHAGVSCHHNDHPVYEKEPRHPNWHRGERMDLYHSGFVPDMNVCPFLIPRVRKRRGEKYTPEQKSVMADKRHYKRDFGGCGNKRWVRHVCSLEGGAWLENDATGGATARTHLTYDGRGTDNHRLDMRKDRPFLSFFNGGCRGILTTNLGEYFVQNGCKYYMGWVYSPGCDYGKFCHSVFARYLRGPKDPQTKERAEDLISRFLPVYRREAARRTRPKYHPRIMDRSGIRNPRNAAHAKAFMHG